jgi:hypothetical protein
MFKTAIAKKVSVCMLINLTTWVRRYVPRYQTSYPGKLMRKLNYSPRSQSYDRELQRQRICNTTNSLACFIRKVFFAWHSKCTCRYCDPVLSLDCDDDTLDEAELSVNKLSLLCSS